MRRAPLLDAPAWILALHQTKGRGRRGRAWADPEGNFAASYLTRPIVPAGQVALYSFVAALALMDALAAVTGRATPFTLKWPNDVLLNGGKLAGILLESAGHGAQLSHLVIGIGVNLRSAPAPESGALRPVSLLSETGITLPPEEFLDALGPAFARWEGRFLSDGFAPIRKAWLERAARLGERIVARTMRQELEGVFEGIDMTGALILRSARTRHAIPAADVFFHDQGGHHASDH
ncbi:MAG: biotin--[acetyl-CoA-carboxylase] ligase [Rhodobacteraceae bacterium]|nr:biotin--[acetyl-CoA-carboxylase] ligase [Paracoccaceae bacterium]